MKNYGKKKSTLILLCIFLAYLSIFSSCSKNNKRQSQLLNIWQDYLKKYNTFNLSSSEHNFKYLDSELSSLITELKIFQTSDSYIIEIDETKSLSAQNIDSALEHAEAALKACHENNKELYLDECKALSVCMNDYLVYSLSSESDFVMPFVELLTIISFLTVSIVFGGVAYMKKKKETELMEAENRRELLVMKTITQVQENERDRISRDLHDTVIQDTRTALLYSREIEKQKNKEEVNNLASKIIMLEERNMKNIRSIIRNLTPPEIETADFSSLLGEYARNIQDLNGIECKYYSEADALLKKLSSEQKLHIFRIIQESVNNAIKHAQATEISIFVRKDEMTDDLIFLVSDDGTGFDINQKYDEKEASDDFSKTGTHLGLRGMNSRASLLGAELNINSNIDCGTQIKIKLKKSTQPTEKSV